MTLKTYLILALALFGTPVFGENKLCPIMVEDEIDEEEVVEFDFLSLYLDFLRGSGKLQKLAFSMYIFAPITVDLVAIVRFLHEQKEWVSTKANK